eukprot:TRINITY_DN8614_c0_g2_i4.p1 TRINITY_DN8614_c0_g2~~TRINITY_DN8614_c0_g2_i4.p1  ORF type:complete len:370 (+),score=82.95 TRINITY_DN8614_c0_g2_i4:65-1111(+)
MAQVASLATGLVAASLAWTASGKEGSMSSETQDVVSVAVAATLLACIVFAMTIYYFIHHKDPDVRRYSYAAISRTISIFCAVLLFSGISELIHDFKPTDAWPLFFFSLGHMVFWCSVTEVILAFTSGTLGSKPTSLVDMENNLKSWGILFAHVAGFASIRCWANFQSIIGTTWEMSLLAVPAGFVALWFLGLVFHMLRSRASQEDDTIDEYEKLFDAEAQECEFDVYGLTLSFLLTQSIRFAIGGFLPTPEGKESEEKEIAEELQQKHGYGQVLAMFGVACLMILMLSIFVYLKPKPAEGGEDAEEEEEEEEARQLGLDKGEAEEKSEVREEEGAGEQEGEEEEEAEQ